MRASRPVCWPSLHYYTKVPKTIYEKRFYWLIVLEISAVRVGPEVRKRITTEALYSKTTHFMNPTVFEGLSLPPEDFPLEGPPPNGSMAS